MNRSDMIRNRVLILISIIIAVAALKWSYPITMPLVTAVFVVAAAWPIKAWLDHVLSPRLSYVGTVIALLLIVGCFFGVIYLASRQVVQIFAREQEQFRTVYEMYATWAEGKGLPTLGGEEGYDGLIAIMETVFWQTYSILGYMGVIAVLVILGLPEVPALARKFREELQASKNKELFDTVEQVADRFRRYIGVTVITSLITGVASTAWTFAVGVELALVWGVLNFLLNFIPVIGNIIGIIPPTLYAIIQFEGWTLPVVVFIGFAFLQITISNFIYPLLQGRGMSMPPVMVVIALLFWGWIWGAAGALLAVPLTAALIITCEHFKSTEKISKILSREG